MAAPYLHEQQYHGNDDDHRSKGRSAVIADLTARVTAVDAERPLRGTPVTHPQSDSSARSTARAADIEGGHPEDDPGDPEAVAKAVCLRLLTTAPRPRAGLAEALRRRGIPTEVAEAVLDRFTEVGLIDDRAYAEAFVASRHRDRGLGAAALRTELRHKGVDADVAGMAAAPIDAEAERRRAEALIARRVDSAMAGGYQSARRRLVGLLARRGYTVDVATSVVDAALASYHEAEAEEF
jgi:regulatory protein